MIKKKGTKIEYIPTPVEIDVFVTEDGTECRSETEAQIHEKKYQEDKEFNDKYRYSVHNGYECIFISDLSQENTNVICRRFRWINRSDLKLGINMIETDDTGDNSFQWIRHPDELIDSLHSEIRSIEEIKDSYLK